MNDFENVDYQIELNQKRLDEEYLRYNQIVSRIGYIMLFYTVYAAYIIQLIQYLIRLPSIRHVYTLFFMLFVISLLISIYHSIRLLIPVKIAYKEMPSDFYTLLKKQYIDNGIPANDINMYIKETYKCQLETGVKHNFNVNNKKSKHNYYAIIFCIIGLLPYIICIGFKVSADKDPVQKVEIVGNIFTDSIVKKQILVKFNMANEDQKQNATTNQTPVTEPAKVDPSKVIVRQPVSIKESADIPEKKE